MYVVGTNLSLKIQIEDVIKTLNIITHRSSLALPSVSFTSENKNKLNTNKYPKIKIQ